MDSEARYIIEGFRDSYETSGRIDPKTQESVGPDPTQHSYVA